MNIRYYIVTLIIRKFCHIYTIQENAKYYISRYILYMLLNSFNYFHYAKLIFFPTNHSFDMHSLLESFRSFVHTCLLQSRDCRSASISMVLSSACRVSHVSCRVSRVACCTSDRHYIEHRSSRHSHRRWSRK